MLTKKANHGPKGRWPELKGRVHRWVLEQRTAGKGLSTVQLRLHALVLPKEMNINDFADRPSWCYRFMQRNRLSIRARTAVCQKLSADFQAKVDSFREFLEKQVTEHNVSSDHIIDTDAVCFWSWILWDKFLNKCDWYMFFSSSWRIFWLMRLILRSDL